MKTISLSQVSFTVLIWIVLFSSHAYGWNCQQDCPSGFLSGKLECEAYQLGCTVEKAVKDPDSFYISARNSSSVPIRVKVKWYVDVVSNDSCVAQVGVKCDPSYWDNGSWDLQPGETALLVKNATRRNAFFSAESLDGTMTWGKKEVDMGSEYGTFTYTFSQ